MCYAATYRLRHTMLTKEYDIISFHIILLLLPITSLATSYAPILEQIRPGTITIIGETHKKPESIEFFKNLVLEAIKNHQCVVIGLEIGSDQQANIDAVEQGKPGRVGTCFSCPRATLR
jgi:hypothetical protein